MHSAINEVLPDLAEVSKDILEETLQSLGIETSDDFKFLEESDLCPFKPESYLLLGN